MTIVLLHISMAITNDGVMTLNILTLHMYMALPSLTINHKAAKIVACVDYM